MVQATADKAGKKSKGDDAKERIIAAAITCIERDGIESTSVRDIAKEAGVNGAAINYYFQSKENLIAATLEKTLDEAFSAGLDDFDRLLAEGHPHRRALELLFFELIANTRAYPRICFAHLREPILEQRYEGAWMQKLNGFIDGMVQRLRTKKHPRSPTQLRLAITQVWSFIMTLGLLPHFFQHAGGVDLSQTESRKAFAAQLARIVLPDP